MRIYIDAQLVFITAKEDAYYKHIGHINKKYTAGEYNPVFTPIQTNTLLCHDRRMTRRLQFR